MAIPMAYLRGEFMPLEDAKIGIMTHAFNYGTAVFEGIRGNWNDDSGELYLFRVRDHVERLRQSAKIMRLELHASDDELVDQIQELAARSELPRGRLHPPPRLQVVGAARRPHAQPPGRLPALPRSLRRVPRFRRRVRAA